MSGENGDGGFVADAPAISTRAELDQRIEARPEPAAEPHLTIEGWQEAQVHREVDDFNEARIQTLESRLERVRNGLNHDYAAARLDGKARTDFGHSR